MLYPSAEELTKNHQSKYSLVIATAKIARKISSDAEAGGIILREKPVKTAVNKIANGEIIFNEKEDEVNTFKYNNIQGRSFGSNDQEEGENSEE